MREKKVNDVFGHLQKIWNLHEASFEIVCFILLLLQLFMHLNDYVQRCIPITPVLDIHVHSCQQKLLNALFVEVDASEMKSGISELFSLKISIISVSFLPFKQLVDYFQAFTMETKELQNIEFFKCLTTICFLYALI